MLRKLLEVSRLLLVLPVIGSLLLTAIVVVMRLGLILVRGWDLLGSPEFKDKPAKVLSVSVIQAIDLFLVGAIGYITAVGIYKLFISQKEEQLLNRVGELIPLRFGRMSYSPFTEDIIEPLRADHFHVAMSGLEGTIQRATALPQMEAYMEVTRAIVVPGSRRRQFSSLTRIIRRLGLCPD